MYPCYYLTNRTIKGLIKNTVVAWKVLRKEKPDIIISSGTTVAVHVLSDYRYECGIIGMRRIMNV